MQPALGKDFAKRFMFRHNIPTARFATFSGRDEALARGATAVRAASSVLVAVRWHAEGISIGRTGCKDLPNGDWRCTVVFRDRDGREMTGKADPSVALTFRGSAKKPALRSCLLTDPQMGRGVDCADRAREALGQAGS